MLNTKALTKVQTVILIAIIGAGAASGGIVYFVSNQTKTPTVTPTPFITPPFSLTPTIPLTSATASATAPTSTTFYTPETLAPTMSPTPTSTLAPTQQPTFSTPTPTIPIAPTANPTPTPTPQPKDPIRIGVCADLDQSSGTQIFRGTTLAVEQINAAGGLVGRDLTVVAEDDDSSTAPLDIAVATNALNKLISVDKADCVISYSTFSLAYQDVCSTQKKIYFSLGDPVEDLTQRIIDNYNKYKYYFRGESLANGTTMDIAHVQSLAALKNMTGFTRVGYLMIDATSTRGQTAPYFESELPKFGLQIVYRSLFPVGTRDFTSYFAQAEAAKTQILFCIQAGTSGSAAIVNEWHNRQSPMILCGDMTGAADLNFWNTTSGNTEFVLTKNTGLTINYPITSQTKPARDAFQSRWGVPMQNLAAAAYDVVKFFLADSITRAGTTDTDTVVKALETIKIDTVLSNDFSFTSDHDIYVDASGMTNLAQTTMLYIVIQWQNGGQVPIFPESLRKASGATLKYPPWPGPWSK